MHVRDVIHGDIFLDGVLEDLVRTEEFQRLAEVKQLGLTDKVYPGATHTRFSHSLGACYLVGVLGARLGVVGEELRLLQVGALLHDVGHYDFSHALELIAPFSHEENGYRIIRGSAILPGRDSGRVRLVLENAGIDPEAIVARLRGASPIPFHSQLLASPVIDVDRMDFLKRDTYCSGAVIGEIDIGRLSTILTVDPSGALGIVEKGMASLEQFLIARHHMYNQVYLHADGRAAEAMLRKAATASPDVGEPYLWGDGQLLTRLAERGTSTTQTLIKRLRAGKRAFYGCAFEVLTTDSEQSRSAVRPLCALGATALENELLSATGAVDGEVIVTTGHDDPEETSIPTFPVLTSDGTWVDFFARSRLGRAVVEERYARTVLAVHAAPEYLPAVRDVISSILI